MARKRGGQIIFDINDNNNIFTFPRTERNTNSYNFGSHQVPIRYSTVQYLAQGTSA